MKRTHISELLRGVLSPDEFQKIYASELNEHLQLLQKKGASASILLTGDEYIFVDRKSFYGLLENFVEGLIGKEFFTYILDALTLDLKSRFVEQEDKELAMCLADDDFNRHDVQSALEKYCEQAVDKKEE